MKGQITPSQGYSWEQGDKKEQHQIETTKKNLKASVRGENNLNIVMVLQDMTASWGWSMMYASQCLGGGKIKAGIKEKLKQRKCSSSPSEGSNHLMSGSQLPVKNQLTPSQGYSSL